MFGTIVRGDKNGVPSLSSPITTSKHRHHDTSSKSMRRPFPCVTCSCVCACVGRVREYAYVNVPISYSVPGTQADGHVLRYAFSPMAADGLQSQLLNAQPLATVSAGVSSIDAVTGAFTWTPDRTGLVSVQVTAHHDKTRHTHIAKSAYVHVWCLLFHLPLSFSSPLPLFCV